MKLLTRLEEIYLLSIWRLKDNAYGVQIRKMIEKMTGKKITYGALYFTLEQLSKKNYVSRTVGEPTPVRGGCSKIYYKLTPVGRSALKDTYAHQQSIWQDVSLLALEPGENE